MGAGAWSESDSEEEGAPASNTQMAAAVFGQLERTVGLAVASKSEGEARGEQVLLACIDGLKLNIKMVNIHIIHGQFMVLTCCIE